MTSPFNHTDRDTPPTRHLLPLYLTPDEAGLLLKALSVAAMEDCTGDLSTTQSYARIVWAEAHGPDSSPFRRSLGPLATALDELIISMERETDRD